MVVCVCVFCINVFFNGTSLDTLWFVPFLQEESRTVTVCGKKNNNNIIAPIIIIIIIIINNNLNN